METPIMKAWREFAMADPENCDQEWSAYLALVQKKESASISPLHNHVHGPAVVPASTPTHSAASLRALSSDISTDDLHEPAATTSAPLTAKSTSASVRAATSPSSDIITVDDLSPGARRCYDYLVGASTTLEPIHDAGVVDAADLDASAPTTCSSERPSHDTDGIPGHSTYVEDPMAMSLTSWSAPTAFNAPPEASPGLPVAISACGDELDTDDTCGREMFVGTEDKDLSDAISSEISTRQSLQLLISRELYTLSSPKLSTICCAPVVTSSTKQQRQMLHSAPWTSLVGGFRVYIQSITPTWVGTNKIYANPALWAFHMPILVRSRCLIGQIILLTLNPWPPSAYLGQSSTLRLHGWEPPWPPPLEFLQLLVFDLEAMFTTSMVLQAKGIDELQPWAHPFGTDCELHFPCFQPTRAIEYMLSLGPKLRWVRIASSIMSIVLAIRQYQIVIAVKPSRTNVHMRNLFNNSAAEVCSPVHPERKSFCDKLIGIGMYWPYVQIFCALRLSHCEVALFTANIMLLLGKTSDLQPWPPPPCWRNVGLQLDDSPGQHPSEKLALPAIPCELHFSIPVIHTLLAACYWVCCMITMMLDTGGRDECVSFLQPKPPWSYLDPTNSTTELRSNRQIVSEPLHTTGIYLQVNLLGSATWYLFCVGVWPEVNFPLASVDQGKLKWCNVFYSCSSRGICLLHDGFNQDWVFSSSVTYLIQCGSASVTWYIAWMLVEPFGVHRNLGGSRNAIMQITVNTMELQPAKKGEHGSATSSFNTVLLSSCMLLLKWPGLLISARHIFSQKLMGADIFSQNWQNNTKLPNPWKWWRSLLLVHLCLQMELGGTVCNVSIPCYDRCLVHYCGTPFSIAVMQVGQTGADFAEPMLLLGAFLPWHQMELQPTQVGVVNILVVLSDDLLHTILDWGAYENSIISLKKNWDPGGFELQFSETAFLIWLVMPWDPGGYAWRRLEVKPNFKDGGLSATCSIPSLGWTVGCHLMGFGPSPRPLQIQGNNNEELGLELDGNGGLGRGTAWTRVACVLWLVLLPPPKSPPSPPLLL